MDKFQEKQLEYLRSGKQNCYDNASIYTVLLDLCLGNDVEEVERLLEEVKKEVNNG